MSARNAGQAGKAELFCSSAQVGEWLKPADCKSALSSEVRRFESFPVPHQRFEMNRLYMALTAFVVLGALVWGDFERSEIAFRHAGRPGNVRAEDLAAAP